MRNSLWIVPFVFVALAIAVGLLLPRVDEDVGATIGIRFGTESGRALLGAIASGMITFTGFVFSILLLAVQFGSSQFSPRLLRRFLRDPSTKAALGTFMATFVYALAVLRVVGPGENRDFVPHNSISLAVVLLVLSMLMFLRLLSRTTQGLRVAAVVAEIGRDAQRVVDRVYPEPAIEDDSWDGPPQHDGAGRTVAYRGAPGVIQSIDIRSLVSRARGADAVIELVPRLGDFIAEGNALFRVFGDDRRLIDDGWLRGAVATGDERTMRQDPAFGFRLLADISEKALSPGVNDPTTAVQALDQIELLLRQVGGRRLTSGLSRDETGRVRLWYKAPTWEDYLSLAIDETRQYGIGSMQVVRRLRALLHGVRDAVPEFRRGAIDQKLALLDSATSRAFADHGDQIAATVSDRQGLGAPSSPTSSTTP